VIIILFFTKSEFAITALAVKLFLTTGTTAHKKAKMMISARFRFSPCCKVEDKNSIQMVFGPGSDRFFT
jgi:hypothetical protein